ncbi:MAG: insulinase family protein [Rhodospirillaceae bacterium]|nr:insulinase family protein [Rhodospirillaceae bacterium]
MSPWRPMLARSGVVAALAIVCVLALRPIAPAAATEVVRVVSPGGIEAWLVEAHAVPVIALSASFAGGNGSDPAELAGLANLTSYLLDEGAGDLDSATFQQREADTGTRMWFRDGQDRFAVNLRTTTEYADDAFELLHLALTAPRFDAVPVERMRAAVLADIRDNVGNPAWFTWRAFYDLAYPDHPYRQPSRGTVATVNAITPDDLHAFVERTFTRDTLVIGVAGDITPDELGRRLDEVFGDLPAAGSQTVLPDQAPGAAGTRVLIEREGAQSQLLMVQTGIARDDPDYYAALVLDHIMGGGSMTSRLTREVRQTRGLTYGIFSGLYDYEATRQWVIAASMTPSSVPEAIDATLAEVSRLRDEGVTQEELDDAITYLTGSFPLALSTTGDIADILEGMQVYDLGIDYLDEHNHRIAAVTLDQVNRVAHERLTPDAMTILVAGPAVDGFTPDVVMNGQELQARELATEPTL